MKRGLEMNLDQHRFVRRELNTFGWIGAVFATFAAVAISYQSLTSLNGRVDQDYLITVPISLYIMSMVFMFLFAMKGKHLPYIVLIPMSLINPLIFYFVFYKYHDGKLKK